MLFPGPAPASRSAHRRPLPAGRDEFIDDAVGLGRPEVDHDLADFKDVHVVVELDQVAGLDQHFIDRDVALGKVVAGFLVLRIDRGYGYR